MNFTTHGFFTNRIGWLKKDMSMGKTHGIASSKG